MKTKVITTPKFIIKPEHNTVVCIMTVDMQLHDSGLWIYTDKRWWESKVPEADDFGRFTVRAIAKCSPDDTFNEVIGKRIAESRAKAKAFNISSKVWLCIAEKLADISSKASSLGQNCAKMQEFEFNRVTELSV